MDSHQAREYLQSPHVQDQVRLLWLHFSCPKYSLLSLNICREISEYLRTVLSLTYFTESHLVTCYFYPCLRVKSVPVSQPIVGCIVTHMSTWEILCVGTYPTSPSVTSVELVSFKLQKEADMCVSRNCPGVIRVKEFVYVFGGYSGGPITTSSEKFSSKQRNWMRLPDMDYPRVYFSPAHHGDEIYLCDAASQPALTTFNVVSEVYKQLSVRIPAMQANASVAFIVNGELYAAMLPHDVIRWRLRSTFPFVATRASDQSLQGFSCTEVVHEGKSVYWTDYNAKKIVKFDLHTLDYYQTS